MLESLIPELQEIGLQLNFQKAQILTTIAQTPPMYLDVNGDMILAWVACFLVTLPVRMLCGTSGPWQGKRHEAQHRQRGAGDSGPLNCRVVSYVSLPPQSDVTGNGNARTNATRKIVAVT